MNMNNRNGHSTNIDSGTRITAANNDDNEGEEKKQQQDPFPPVVDIAATCVDNSYMTIPPVLQGPPSGTSQYLYCPSPQGYYNYPYMAKLPNPDPLLMDDDDPAAHDFDVGVVRSRSHAQQAFFTTATRMTRASSSSLSGTPRKGHKEALRGRGISSGGVSSSSSSNGDEHSASMKKKSRRGYFWWCGKRVYNRWIKNSKNVMSSFSSLIVALVLWYMAGVVSIGTSKLLLMPPTTDDQHANKFGPHGKEYYDRFWHYHPHYHHNQHRHHSYQQDRHPLIGGVPPLYLTLQQLIIGATLFRFLLHFRFLGSQGLVPWPVPTDSIVRYPYHHPYYRTARNTPFALWVQSLHPQLLATGLFFAIGFLMTNFGFSGSSAAFVETIKAAEPITSATVAVWSGIEVLSRNEMTSLGAIVFGVILSTLGNASSSSLNGKDNPDEQHGTPRVMMESLGASAIVMVANLSFSFRGLYQKLFRLNPEGSTQLMDDLNLQFRMQQIGIVLLILPVIFFDLLRIFGHLWTLHQVHGLWTSGVTSRYMELALLNGTCFAVYNLASTYILSRISVVHHAALNCVRRVFAIVITSIYFVIPITFLGSLGILTSFVGFMSFTHYKVKRQRQPKPLSSLLPVSLSEGK